jgi:cytochrome c oxidase assembly protein subunit 15
VTRLRQFLRRVSSQGFTADEFRRICVAALVFVAAIVVTGAAVRLSGSGLGCDDWPNCNASSLVDVSSQHSAIEQINRLFTFVVGLAVVLAALGAWVRRPRRRDLMLLAAALVAGIPAQGIVGAIVVWTDLNPFAVQLHFVLSMGLVAVAVVLLMRASEPDAATRALSVSAATARRARLLVVWTALALIAGTVVTGTGPHAGDEQAKRFTFFSITWAARLHSVVVWIAVLIAFSLLWRLRTHTADRRTLDAPLTAWVCVAIAQGAVGYLQYAQGVPAPLVGVHVALATTLWGCSVWLWWATTKVTAPDPPPLLSVSSVGQTLHEGGQLVDGVSEERAD